LPSLAIVPQLRLACWPNGFSWSSVKIATAVTSHEEDVISILHNPTAMHGGLGYGSCGLACPLCPAAPGLPSQWIYQVQFQCHGPFHRNGRNRLYEEASISKWADARHYAEVFPDAPYIWQDAAHGLRRPLSKSVQIMALTLPGSCMECFRMHDIFS